MDREIDLHLDWEGETLLVGRLWARSKGKRETASFEYARDWRGRRGAFSLDPNLPLRSGQFHTAGGLFNAFTDPAPDRGGRNLLSRRERHQARGVPIPTDVRAASGRCASSCHRVGTRRHGLPARQAAHRSWASAR